MSKGSGRRPQDISDEEMDDHWARIFGAKAEASSNKDEHDGQAAEVPDDRGV
jgi:hypothetical protein